MNAYDFDETIYDGDSTADFFRYCRKRSLKIRLLSPWYLAGFVPYGLGFSSKTRAKQHFYNFVRAVPDIKSWVDDFWDKNESKIKPWYKERRKPDDIVISASPRFILRDICARLKIEHLICSEVDEKTGVYSGINCHGEEKVRRFREEWGDSPIEEFYSDSLNDAPLSEIAERAFCVRGHDLIPWNEYFKKE